MCTVCAINYSAHEDGLVKNKEEKLCSSLNNLFARSLRNRHGRAIRTPHVVCITRAMWGCWETLPDRVDVVVVYEARSSAQTHAGAGTGPVVKLFRKRRACWTWFRLHLLGQFALYVHSFDGATAVSDGGFDFDSLSRLSPTTSKTQKHLFSTPTQAHPVLNTWSTLQIYYVNARRTQGFGRKWLFDVMLMWLYYQQFIPNPAPAQMKLFALFVGIQPRSFQKLYAESLFDSRVSPF